MKVNEFVWKIGGEAGYGIMTAGLLFARTILRKGLWVFANNEYPSLIRGGHNTYDIRVSEKQVLAPLTKIDILVALNEDTINRHKDKMVHGGGIIYDKEIVTNIDKLGIREDIKLYDVPLKKTAKDFGQEKLMQNTVAMGASLALLKADFCIFEEMLKDWFKGKKDAIIQSNIDASKIGYNHVLEHHNMDEFAVKLEPRDAPKRAIIGGSEALAIGAIRAGLKFHSQYPMTPSSGVLHYLMKVSRKKDIVVVQPEDEIAAINMAIGASYSGVRSMTATSGGGFALMAEGLGLAGLIETPLVINVAMRPGPATGLPTKSGQSDLRFVMHAAQDEFPRMIIAPGDQEECFYCAMHAFNFAEKYQIPVFILTDKYLAESYGAIDFPDQDKVKVDRGKLITGGLPPLEANMEFKRYEFTNDGVSPRTIPGVAGGIYTAGGDEHDEFSTITEDQENRVLMHSKRLRKMTGVLQEMPKPKMYGDEDADVTLVSWGSNKQNVLEAIEMLKKDGIKVNLMHIVYIYPFPTDYVRRLLETSKNVIAIESNATAQMVSLVREHCMLDIKHKILKFDGIPMHVDWLYEKIKDEVEKCQK